MATFKVAAKPEPAPMKVMQISKPGGDFEFELGWPAASNAALPASVCE